MTLQLDLFPADPADEPVPGAAALAALDTALPGLAAALSSVFDTIDRAEDEIRSACRRHPDQADRIYHSFMLLTPTQDRMKTERVYRRHCAELLDRVAAGADTRPGTAIEVCCAMLATSLLAPLRSAAAGLYMRMWLASGLPSLGADFTAAAAHHEALEASTIDDHEAFARRKLAVPDRRLGAIECEGRHDGEPVTCTYATREP